MQMLSKNKYLSSATFALLLGGAGAVSAQSDVQLPLQYGMQQLLGNPAALQDHRVSIALPSVSGSFSSPYSVNDIGEVRDGTLHVDSEAFIASLSPRGNDQRIDFSAESFAFNYRHRAWQLGVSHRVRAVGSLDFPRGLAQLTAYGNAPYVGEVLELAPVIDAQAFQEFAVNGAYTFWDKVTLGARAKFLLGSAAWQTGRANASLYTDPDFYEIRLESHNTYRTAGIPVTMSDTVLIGELGSGVGAGTGFGIDLGVIYRHNQDLELGFSVRDAGFVNWTGEARKHQSNGQFVYSGYEGDFFAESLDFDVAGVIDSLVGEVEFETTDEEFTTKLPLYLQATGRYRVAPNTSLSATAIVNEGNVWHAGFGVGATQRFGRFGQFGVLGGLKHGGPYVGANLLVDVFGPQFYVACDNVLSAFDLSSARTAHFRAGLNLAFGQIAPRKDVQGWYDLKVEGINK